MHLKCNNDYYSRLLSQWRLHRGNIWERELRCAFYWLAQTDSLLPFSQAPTLSWTNCDPFIVEFLFEKHHDLIWKLCAHENGFTLENWMYTIYTFGRQLCNDNAVQFCFSAFDLLISVYRHSNASGCNIYCYCRPLTKLPISNKSINIFMKLWRMLIYSGAA